MAHPDRGLSPRLQRLIDQTLTAAASDAELLQRFADHRDDAAFAILVRRHARLVMSVCQRLLGNAHDAEDAFQATFLVLARKARAQCWRSSIGSWLYEVAYRVACKARGRRARRHEVEQQAVAALPAREWRDMTVSDLCARLDQELVRLPDRYRRVVLLCCVHGQTPDEAARELGCSVGAARGCLHRGRELLRQRLARHGVQVSAVLLSTALCQVAVAAAAPPTLLQATAQAGAAFAGGKTVLAGVSSNSVQLAQGVLLNMALAKVRMAAWVSLLLAALGWGAGTWLAPAQAGLEPVARAEAAPPPRPEDDHRFLLPAGVRGTLRAVDTAKPAVTIALGENGDDEAVEVSFDAAKDAKVQVAGKPAAWADLKPGGEVVLTLAADKRTVAALAARGKQIDGKFSRLDAAGGTLTIQDDDEDNPGLHSFTIGKDVPVYIDDYLGALKDVADCHEVTVELAADNKTAARILARWALEGDAQGKIIKNANGQITLESEGDDDVVSELTFGVAADTKLYVNGQPAKAADLQPGWTLTVRLKQGKVASVVRAVKRAPEASDDD